MIRAFFLVLLGVLALFSVVSAAAIDIVQTIPHSLPNTNIAPSNIMAHIAAFKSPLTWRNSATTNASVTAIMKANPGRPVEESMPLALDLWEAREVCHIDYFLHNRKNEVLSRADIWYRQFIDDAAKTDFDRYTEMGEATYFGWKNVRTCYNKFIKYWPLITALY